MNPDPIAGHNLLGMSRPKLEAFFVACGEKPFRASQLLRWIHGRGVADFAAMTDLSKDLRSRLLREARLAMPRLITERRSEDGTRKWVLGLDGGNAIETVFIPESGRGTLCVSSQVGCALDCTFCATARQGFNRNLDAAEIIAQLWFARRALQDEYRSASPITNVVLMGMGEPLLNLDNVVDALQIMLDDHAYGLSKRRVTVSTSGLVPAMDRLRARIDVSLAVSLHAPDDALRDRLVPLNRKYPIAELLSACRRFVAHKHRKHTVTMEYVMLKEVNDSCAQARALARLLRDMPCKVNLIPFNPFPGTRFRRSDPAVIDRFAEVLHAHGITSITRRPRGQDIDAACGQLVGQVRDRSRRQTHFLRLDARQASRSEG
jgi:23S rRNA (adenine2503-C2)-methyltransferase